MGSDESHFNVSVGSDGQSHRTVSRNHNLFEEKGEPKRYRTEVLPLTNLTLIITTKHKVWNKSRDCDVMEKIRMRGRKCILRYEPALFCFSLVKSKPLWLLPEEVKFGARLESTEQALEACISVTILAHSLWYVLGWW